MMSPFKSRDVVGVLEDLLDKERSAILSGNFTGLDRLLAEKERLILAGAAEVSVRKLKTVLDKANRNRVLLNSAGQGIRAVSKRLSQLRSPGETLQTYNKSGQRITHRPTGPIHERRA